MSSPFPSPGTPDAPEPNTPGTRALAWPAAEGAAPMDEAQRYRACFATLPGLLFEVDLHTGELTWVSDNAERLSGYPRSVLLGAGGPWRRFVHPDDTGEVERAVRDAAAAGRWDVEFRLQHRDGYWRWFRSTGQLAPAPDGGPPRVAHGIALVNEEQKRLGLRERTYRELVRAASRSLVTDEVLVHVVEAARQLLDADRATMWLPDDDGLTMRNVGQAGSAIVPILDVRLDDERSMVARTFLTNSTECVTDYASVHSPHADRMRPNAAGPVLTVPVQVDGVPAGVLGVVRARGRPAFSPRDLEDATHLAAQAGFALANAQRYHAAVDANRAKTSFLSTLSHELRTPLGTIEGFLDLLVLEAPLTPRQHEHLARVRRASAHLLHLVEDLFDLSRIEHGRARLTLRAFDAREPVAHAVELVRGSAEAKGLVVADLNGPHPAWTQADADRVRQILVNLLGNAVKFTTHGRVSAWCETGGARVHIYVRDTGEGIASELHERIFEPFFQVHDVRPRDAAARARDPHGRDPAGAGIGLAVSRSLARAMGGDLQVDSVPGQGSTFTLTLPAAPSPPA